MNSNIHIAHVVNVYGCPGGSEGHRVQAITLESMKRAREMAGTDVAVEFISAQFAEDRGAVPPFVTATPDLDRSIQNEIACTDKRKLPFIHDILSRAEQATDAEFLLYSNMDIALYPGFYRFLASTVREGVDALAVNRTQIPRMVRGRDILTDASLDEIVRVGDRRPHHGIDCVMFRRDKFKLWPAPNICIGYPPVGQYLMENAEFHAQRFVWIVDDVRTFHIGVDDSRNSPWKKLVGNEIWNFNHAEFDACRLYRQSAWERHGHTTTRWRMRRARWLLRSWLKPPKPY